MKFTPISYEKMLSEKIKDRVYLQICNDQSYVDTVIFIEEEHDENEPLSGYFSNCRNEEAQLIPEDSYFIIED